MQAPRLCRNGDTAERDASLPVYVAVPLYFFDTRDGDAFIEDDVGLELPDLERVKIVAAKSLTDLARDVLPGSIRRTLVVEVRDKHEPVMLASLTFEAVVLAPQ